MWGAEHRTRSPLALLPEIFERDEEGASVAGSGLAWGDRARTFEIAVAVLEVRALDVPAHGSAPNFGLFRRIVFFEPQEAFKLPNRTIHSRRRGVRDGHHEQPVQPRDHERGDRVRIN